MIYLGMLHIIFRTFVPEVWTLIYDEISFRSISWELPDIFSPNFIYTLILTRSCLGLLHLIFRKLVPELWPFIYAKILLPLNYFEPIDRISPNFIYAFILARSSLGLLHVIFSTFAPELGPLIYAKILFLLNILRRNWHIFTKLYIYAFKSTRSNLGLLHVIFQKFVPELWPFICAQISFPLNILRTNW